MGIKNLFFIFILFVFVSGCTTKSGNVGQIQFYPAPKLEAEWVRNGQPVEFESELWFPIDDVETLTDSEVIPIGMFQGVQIFVEKTDVRPYDRLYTKFDVNQYRFYERNNN